MCHRMVCYRLEETLCMMSRKLENCMEEDLGNAEQVYQTCSEEFNYRCQDYEHQDWDTKGQFLESPETGCFSDFC